MAASVEKGNIATGMKLCDRSCRRTLEGHEVVLCVEDQI